MTSSSSPHPEASPISVLFVCLGNICRSTMAEGVFRALVAQPPYQARIAVVDSCGTAAYHAGSGPDERTMQTLEAHGVRGYVHAARKVSVLVKLWSLACQDPSACKHVLTPRVNVQIQESDFSQFDFIFAMDRDNLRNLQQVQQRCGGKAKAKLMLFGEYAGKKKAEEVDDPYYGGQEGFEAAYEQCTRFTRNFLREVFPDAEV